jgi:hypothetical protein
MTGLEIANTMAADKRAIHRMNRQLYWGMVTSRNNFFTDICPDCPWITSVAEISIKDPDVFGTGLLTRKQNLAVIEKIKTRKQLNNYLYYAEIIEVDGELMMRDPDGNLRKLDEEEKEALIETYNDVVLSQEEGEKKTKGGFLHRLVDFLKFW